MQAVIIDETKGDFCTYDGTKCCFWKAVRSCMHNVFKLTEERKKEETKMMFNSEAIRLRSNCPWESCFSPAVYVHTYMYAYCYISNSSREFDFMLFQL